MKHIPAGKYPQISCGHQKKGVLITDTILMDIFFPLLPSEKDWIGIISHCHHLSKYLLNRVISSHWLSPQLYDRRSANSTQHLEELFVRGMQEHLLAREWDEDPGFQCCHLYHSRSSASHDMLLFVRCTHFFALRSYNSTHLESFRQTVLIIQRITSILMTLQPFFHMPCTSHLPCRLLHC